MAMFQPSKMASALNAVGFSQQPGFSTPGLVKLGNRRAKLSVDEELAAQQAEFVGDIDCIFFRRFSDGRSSQVAAYVIDNSDDRHTQSQLAEIHRRVSTAARGRTSTATASIRAR